MITCNLNIKLNHNTEVSTVRMKQGGWTATFWRTWKALNIVTKISQSPLKSLIVCGSSLSFYCRCFSSSFLVNKQEYWDTGQLDFLNGNCGPLRDWPRTLGLSSKIAYQQLPLQILPGTHSENYTRIPANYSTSYGTPSIRTILKIFFPAFFVATPQWSLDNPVTTSTSVRSRTLPAPAGTAEGWLWLVLRGQQCDWWKHKPSFCMRDSRDWYKCPFSGSLSRLLPHLARKLGVSFLCPRPRYWNIRSN